MSRVTGRPARAALGHSERLAANAGLRKARTPDEAVPPWSGRFAQLAVKLVQRAVTLPLAQAQLGRLPEARALARQELERASRWGAPSTIAVALRVAGVTEGGEGGIELLREVVGVAERSPSRYEHARCLSELGAVLRRSGRRVEARQPLREALDLAHRCGARRVAGKARQELVAAGARPRSMVLTGVDALTASERRVAQLAADGLANREIAQALFVTKRTVEMHLTHTYQKLDVGSRSELRAMLGSCRAPTVPLS